NFRGQRPDPFARREAAPAVGAMSSVAVLGISREEAALARALERLRERGYQQVKTFSPIPSERLAAPSAHRESAVRYYTLTGGILGFAMGLAFTIWTSLQAPSLLGGKPVVSLPPFLVIAFELT